MKDDKLKTIEEMYKNKELTAEQTLKRMFELFDEEGVFDVDDIKFAYEVGRAHEKNNSTCTSNEIREAWLRGDQLYRHLRWD